MEKKITGFMKCARPHFVVQLVSVDNRYDAYATSPPFAVAPDLSSPHPPVVIKSYGLSL